MRVPNSFFGTRVFRYLKLGSRDLKAKLGASFGIESMRARWDAKYNPRDYGIAQILGRDYGIEEPY